MKKEPMIDATGAALNVLDRPSNHKKKLIEVALPLTAINEASARDKSSQRGHPAALHPWWARRPLAACRAVLFASLVTDPSADSERFPTVESQERERQRLFSILKDLLFWKNMANEQVLARARTAIRDSLGEEMPTVYDPFCGRGSIPIEAQRLGLNALASDLNPIAVMIAKAAMEMPRRFRGCSPVYPSLSNSLLSQPLTHAAGLAADVEAYSADLLGRARSILTEYYPPVTLEDGRQVEPMAWLWARTVRCGNPVCSAVAPLVKSFALSTRPGKEWSVNPIVNRESKSITFEIGQGKPRSAGTVNRRGATCIFCNEPLTFKYIRSEGKAKRLGARLMAIVVDAPVGRLYLPPEDAQENVAANAVPPWKPTTSLPAEALGFRVQAYGLSDHEDLFPPRALVALTTFVRLVKETHAEILRDAKSAGMVDDSTGFEAGGIGALAYADTVTCYLALAVDRLVNAVSSLTSWNAPEQCLRNAIEKKVSMTWDYCEANPFSDASGGLAGSFKRVTDVIAAASAGADAKAFLRDASDGGSFPRAIFCTDPPYYDNVPYADLADIFYIWLKASLEEYFPDIFSTVLVPKQAELVADRARFAGNENRARAFFQDGLERAFTQIRLSAEPDIPTTVFYAYKQRKVETSTDPMMRASRVSAGWEVMLNSLIRAGFQITGTWPLESEPAGRLRSIDSNALESSIVLVCRPRPHDAPRCTRVDFLRDLRNELPSAKKRLTDASLAATDLEQAAIGPGMAVFTRYSEVLEPDGTAMSVRAALALINDELSQLLLGEIANVDAETHFALSWFDSHAYQPGSYGEAEVLLNAKNANLDILRQSGVIDAGAGVVRLRSPQEIAVPGAAMTLDGRLRTAPVWAQLMHVIGQLTSEHGGEESAVELLRTLESDDLAGLKDVAYHCYTACVQLNRSSAALDFNVLVTAWPELQGLLAQSDSRRLF